MGRVIAGAAHEPAPPAVPSRGDSAILCGPNDRPEPSPPGGRLGARRAVLRLAAGAGLAGLGLLTGCGGKNPYDKTPSNGSDQPVILRLGGNRGTERKAKFGSGRGWIR